MGLLPKEWIECVTAILDAGRAGTRAITNTARMDWMALFPESFSFEIYSVLSLMQKIMSKEPVVIPDGKGGVRERFLVEVPALEDEKTGEIFLEDEALEILDREKTEAMARYAAQFSIHKEGIC